MPNPRNFKAFENIGQEIATFSGDGSIVYDATKPNGSAQVGLAVKMTGNSTVGLTTDGSMVVGKLIRVADDGSCSVQTEGGMTLPGGLAATLTAGLPIVGATGAAAAQGYVRAVAPAVLAEVANERGFILDSSTATAVAIYLT